MKLFDWSEELVTNVDLIDRQHQEYRRRANAFLKRCVEEGGTEKELAKTFEFLESYVREHLRTEEGLMAEYDYPHRAQHEGQHHYLASWIKDTQATLGENGSLDTNTVLKVNFVLVDWFQKHILTVDKQLTTFLCEIADRRKDRKLLRLIKGVFASDK